MPFSNHSRWRSGALSILIAAALSGCAGLPDAEPPSGQPTFYRGLAQPGAKLDADAAASMISGYRRNNGLAAVSLDPALMRLADEQARAMAARDRMDHNVGGAFTDRLRKSGY